MCFCFLKYEKFDYSDSSIMTQELEKINTFFNKVSGDLESMDDEEVEILCDGIQEDLDKLMLPEIPGHKELLQEIDDEASATMNGLGVFTFYGLYYTPISESGISELSKQRIKVLVDTCKDYADFYKYYCKIWRDVWTEIIDQQKKLDESISKCMDTLGSVLNNMTAQIQAEFEARTGTGTGAEAPPPYSE